MTDGLTVIWLIIGFGFLVVAGARLGAGSHTSLTGLFPPRGARDWPTGVQEPDAPRFEVSHLDGLRPRREGGIRTSVVDVVPLPEIVELGARRIDRRR
jgi:hypothetical protein